MNIIQVLPDHLSNQIAAGEVVQRPASVVKELLENAIDAGATEIQLIVKDSGKALIQVVDNGKGMSPADAGLSFSRHATSKISVVEDLFSIKTMGFRGEALASIAAVAQVVLKSRRAEEELGTRLVVEASEIKLQEATACDQGTSIAVQNLFYNVPARRKFLKSNTAEYKHILEEFTRIALAYPEISFRLFHNNTEQFHLRTDSLKGRIIGLLGNRAEKNLVPVEENSDLVHIRGFIGKPEVATRTRGNQFFFINRRFIRSPYLNHAVTNAFEGLIEKEAYPYYVLFIEIDPERVDVNVHPSKQEVKFDDERLLYAFLQATIKHALAKFNIAPSLDFSQDNSFQNLDALKRPFNAETLDKVEQGYLKHTFSSPGKAHLVETDRDRQVWKMQQSHFMPEMPEVKEGSVRHDLPFSSSEGAGFRAPESSALFDAELKATTTFVQWNGFLVTTVKSGLLLINQKLAMERIAFEQLQDRIAGGTASSQQLLFPVNLTLSPAEVTLLEEALPFFQQIGYDIRAFGKGDYVIQGAPPDLAEDAIVRIVQEILEQVAQSPAVLKDPGGLAMLRLAARRMARIKPLQAEEMQQLIDELFACRQAQYSPDGKPIFRILNPDDLNRILSQF